jgi:hypothetical protein
MSMVRGSKLIRLAQLRAQLGALKLEAKGMRRRGRSLTAMLRDYYRLPPRCTRAGVIAAVEREIELLEAEVMKNQEGASVQ